MTQQIIYDNETVLKKNQFILYKVNLFCAGNQTHKNAVHGHTLRGTSCEWKVGDNLCKLPFLLLTHSFSEPKLVLTNELFI